MNLLDPAPKPRSFSNPHGLSNRQSLAVVAMAPISYPLGKYVAETVYEKTGSAFKAQLAAGAAGLAFGTVAALVAKRVA